MTTRVHPAPEPQAIARTVLVGVDLGQDHFDGTLAELGLLAQTAGLQPVARVACKRRAPLAGHTCHRLQSRGLREQPEFCQRTVEMVLPEIHAHQHGARDRLGLRRRVHPRRHRW